jgi:hypothetical protein
VGAVAADGAEVGDESASATHATKSRAGIFTMTMNLHARGRLFAAWLSTAALWLCAMCIASAVGAAVPQRSFASPDAATEALIGALKAHDRPAVVAILGAASDKWISSGDTVADRAAIDHFVASFEQKHVIAPEGEGRAVLSVGADDWPFAFPLVKSSDGAWRFDTAAGKDELLARRIGQNELAVINVMLAIVDAQREYALGNHTRDGVAQYAKKFASSAGKQDGLYWPTKAGQPESPLGPLVRRATAEGYQAQKSSQPRPYHGYYFRMLTGQGPHAKGGALDYVVKGRMIGGFAAVAYPAQYANSGVMTFIVDHDGVVYQRDLGPDTAEKARAMTRFDPGPEWTPAPAK